MPTVRLNGDTVELEKGTSLEHALQKWNYTDKKCAVAINGEFVPRPQHQNVILTNDDEIDVVAPVGGG